MLISFVQEDFFGAPLDYRHSDEHVSNRHDFLHPPAVWPTCDFHAFIVSNKLICLGAIRRSHELMYDYYSLRCINIKASASAPNEAN